MQNSVLMVMRKLGLHCVGCRGGGLMGGSDLQNAVVMVIKKMMVNCGESC